MAGGQAGAAAKCAEDLLLQGGVLKDLELFPSGSRTPSFSPGARGLGSERISSWGTTPISEEMKYSLSVSPNQRGLRPMASTLKTQVSA